MRWICLIGVLAVATSARADDKPNVQRGEVIVIEDSPPPVVAPKPTNFKPMKAPPYSDEAMLTDIWTKAWMLLDVSETGVVTRFKFLKKPGADLERIAATEVWKLRFEPARDAQGKPMRTQILWEIEWPSAWWLVTFTGVTSGMPPIVGFPPRSLADSVPCRGSGPLNLGSVHPTYRDCSRPDLTKAATATWVDAPRARR